MAKLWSTGPVHIYLGINGTAKLPVYLGTGEHAPDIDIHYEYTPVMNDIGGQRVPFDRIYDGSEAAISVVLTRWNEDTMAFIMSVPSGTGLIARGSQGVYDIGTIMGSEGFTFPIYLMFPKSPVNAGGLPAMTGMPAGYRFISCINMTNGIRPGTKVNKMQVMFQAQRAWTSAVGTSGPVPNPATVGSLANANILTHFILYDHDMSALIGIN